MSMGGFARVSLAPGRLRGRRWALATGKPLPILSLAMSSRDCVHWGCFGAVGCVSSRPQGVGIVPSFFCLLYWFV